MNVSTSNYIDQLLLDEDIHTSKKKSSQNIDEFNFSEETILITGAAGTIGSELSKQLINISFKKLILIDIAESPLYNLIKALEFKDTSSIEFVIINITDTISLQHFFKTHKPTIVFHAAAYKHVPLMEQNPYEGVKLNILGTKHLANLSIKNGVKKFIFISTDKAVNPISVMGMTKYIAENYLRNLATKSNTLFLITRFGNILGSNGSVIPILKKQIETNAPITITDKKTTRFFINKYKACYLILKIAALKTTSNTFTFNMGDPLKIIDIIERLLALYKIPKETITIYETGLRPGEKLHEKIVNNNETLETTLQDDILLVNTDNAIKLKKVDFTPLLNITSQMSNTEIKSTLKKYL